MVCANKLMTFNSVARIEDLKGHQVIFTIKNDSLGEICVDTLSEDKPYEIYEIPEHTESEFSTGVVSVRESLDSQFLSFLEEAGIKFDDQFSVFFLNSKQRPEIFPKERNNLIDENFDDYYYDNLIFEINFSWKIGLFNSTLTLCRKMIENLIIEILRLKFPRNKRGNLQLYFDIRVGRFHNLSQLLVN